jgi:hypothetical protein
MARNADRFDDYDESDYKDRQRQKDKHNKIRSARKDKHGIYHVGARNSGNYDDEEAFSKNSN